MNIDIDFIESYNDDEILASYATQSTQRDKIDIQAHKLEKSVLSTLDRSMVCSTIDNDEKSSFNVSLEGKSQGQSLRSQVSSQETIETKDTANEISSYDRFVAKFHQYNHQMRNRTSRTAQSDPTDRLVITRQSIRSNITNCKIKNPIRPKQDSRGSQFDGKTTQTSSLSQRPPQSSKHHRRYRELRIDQTKDLSSLKQDMLEQFRLLQKFRPDIDNIFDHPSYQNQELMASLRSTSTSTPSTIETVTTSDQPIEKSTKTDPKLESTRIPKPPTAEMSSHVYLRSNQSRPIKASKAWDNVVALDSTNTSKSSDASTASTITTAEKKASSIRLEERIFPRIRRGLTTTTCTNGAWKKGRCNLSISVHGSSHYCFKNYKPIDRRQQLVESREQAVRDMLMKMYSN